MANSTPPVSSSQGPLLPLPVKPSVDKAEKIAANILSSTSEASPTTPLHIAEKPKAEPEVTQIATSTLSPPKPETMDARAKEIKQQIWKQKEEFRLKLQQELSKTAPTKDFQEAFMQAKTAEMDAYLKYMEAAEGFRGAVLIQEKGKPLFSAGCGPADAKGTPNTPKTRFLIGSVTKQFTGAAIALLMQDKKLITNQEIHEFDLKTPINNLLPKDYRDKKWDNITLEHLLRHSSGIAGYGGDPQDALRPKNFTVKELMNLAKSQEILFQPGVMFGYSNTGYGLLGAVIENASGLSLERFMEEYIFNPCHMTQTGMLSSYHELPVAAGFAKKDTNSPLETVAALETNAAVERHLSKVWAAGGIISTVEDLAAWDRALWGNALLSDTMKEMMFSCPTPLPEFAPDNPNLKYKGEKGHFEPMEGQEYYQPRYGFGIMMLHHKLGGPFLGHTGAIRGFSSVMDRYPDSQRSIIALTNVDDSGVEHREEKHLVEILFAGEKPPETPTK